MLFFRSEDRVREWCAGRRAPVRPVVRMNQLWGLATTWYASRLRADARRPQPEEIVGVFARLGLVDDFWNPRSDRF